jgi:16S rRNA (cytosine1402-N4)-methyltransferase
MMSDYHVPVLLHDAVDGLKISAGGVYVDVTFGGGGHTRAILNKLGPDGRLIAIDQDADALANAPDDRRLTLVHGNFGWLRNYLEYLDAGKVDGILADLGVSSHQFDAEERGFSFRADVPLDMRMDATSGEPAWQMLQAMPHGKMAAMLREYGEIANAGALANGMLKALAEGKLNTTGQLADVAGRFRGKAPLKKYLAMVFQAIRIAVNREMEVLEQFLKSTADVLKPGGRLVVISYHSLEDRMVKQWVRGDADGGDAAMLMGGRSALFQEITRKPVQPTEQEIEDNPRARSARMRIAERK